MRFRALMKFIRAPLAWLGFLVLTIPYVVCGIIEFWCNAVLEACESYDEWAFKERDE